MSRLYFFVSVFLSLFFIWVCVDLHYFAQKVSDNQQNNTNHLNNARRAKVARNHASRAEARIFAPRVFEFLASSTVCDIKF